jgi:hypothetical protein
LAALISDEPIKRGQGDTSGGFTDTEAAALAPRMAEKARYSAGMTPANSGAIMNRFGIWVVVGGVIACSKTEPPAPAASSQVPSMPPPMASSSATAAEAPAATATAAAATPTPPAGAPESFKGGTKETIAQAVGLGCEPTSLNGWLQLLCRKKNGTGGHPVKATISTPGEAAAAPPEPTAEADVDAGGPSNEITPNEQGELTIVVPYAGEEKRDVVIEWTDTQYTLHVTGAKATLSWAGSGVPHRRACQQLLDETKAVIAASQKLEGEARLTTTEAQKLPRFGQCWPAGLGSYALALKALQGKGEGAARQHHFELEVVRIDVEGGRKSTSFGNVDAAPGGFELAPLQVYDYDDDGRNELIVPYELKATGGGAPQSFPPAIWTFSDAGVSAYAKAPVVSGGIGVEQLEFDMRPDLGTYGPFVAYLGSDCGAKTCPPRLTGPKLYLHSTPEGGFTDNDDAAKNALKRAACQNKPMAVVVDNLAQTAKNLVCAKAYGVGEDVITAELTAKKAALCGEAPTCPVLTTFESWLKQPLPVALSAAPPKK